MPRDLIFSLGTDIPADSEWQSAGCEGLSQPIRVADIHLIHLQGLSSAS